MKLQLLYLLPLASIASADWSKNLNYRSPSEHHPALGISIHKVVWSRVAPQSDNSQSNVTVSGYAPLYDHDNEKYVQISKSPICVEYKVTTDKDLTDTVDSGKVFTSSDVDFTVKVR